MAQICHLLKTFHKKGVGCFLDIKDLYITSNNVVKLNSLFSCFSVSSWDEVSTTTKDSYAKLSDDKVFYPSNTYEYDYTLGIDPETMVFIHLDDEKKRSRMMQGL